jgi:hypothetical protein
MAAPKAEIHSIGKATLALPEVSIGFSPVNRPNGGYARNASSIGVNQQRRLTLQLNMAGFRQNQ